MSNASNTTPVGVSNPPPAIYPTSALTAFTAIVDDLLVMIETDEDAGGHRGTAYSSLCDDAALAEARCRTAVNHFLSRTDADPLLQAAVWQICGLINDLGDTPDLLARYPRRVMRLADHCTQTAATNARHGFIDMHSVRCADALTRAAELLERMVQSALDEITVPDAPTLSIPEMLTA